MSNPEDAVKNIAEMLDNGNSNTVTTVDENEVEVIDSHRYTCPECGHSILLEDVEDTPRVDCMAEHEDTEYVVPYELDYPE